MTSIKNLFFCSVLPKLTRQSGKIKRKKKKEKKPYSFLPMFQLVTTNTQTRGREKQQQQQPHTNKERKSFHLSEKSCWWVSNFRIPFFSPPNLSIFFPTSPPPWRASPSPTLPPFNLSRPHTPPPGIKNRTRY